MSGRPVLPQLLRSDHSGRSPGLSREAGLQAFGLLPDAADLVILTLSTPLAIRLPLSNDFVQRTRPGTCRRYLSTYWTRRCRWAYRIRNSTSTWVLIFYTDIMQTY